MSSILSINSYTPEQVVAIDNIPTLRVLPDNLVQYVTPKQVPDLADNQFEHLATQAQVAAVPVAKCKLLPERLVKHITPSQVEHLNDYQLLHLITKEQLAAVPAKRYWRLAQNVVPLLPADADLSELLPLHFPFLSREQVSSIRDPKIISVLVKGILETRSAEIRQKGIALFQYVKPSVIAMLEKYLDPKLVKRIDCPEFIQALPDALVMHVDPSQVGHLTSEQIQQLKKREQLQQVKWRQLSYLTVYQYAELTKCQKIVYVISTVVAGIFSAVLSLAILPLLLIPSVREWATAPAGRLFSAIEYLIRGR